LRKELKRRIDCLQVKAKRLLKQRLDFPCDKGSETMDRVLTMEAKKLLQQRFDFPFEKRIEATNKLNTMQGQKIVQTTVRFSM